jgi:hypothetical protein
MALVAVQLKRDTYSLDQISLIRYRIPLACAGTDKCGFMVWRVPKTLRELCFIMMNQIDGTPVRPLQR